MTFKEFLSGLNQRMGVPLPEYWETMPELQLAQRFLEGLNEYFFQAYDGIGTTEFQGEELLYFSEFHKFWEAHHAEILNARIDREQAELTAHALARAVEEYGTDILGLTHETHGLSKRPVAQVRFFTANQDFREPPVDQFERYLEDPTRFDPREIAQAPEEFLRFMGMTRLSQNDKRADFARNAAQF
ncbi:MAG: hypothetical protein KAX19_01715, partial [Candidatus Brocadiae bacterium]|nr:hypothetical protein [Candidatus Brocadiia bacterium]